MIHLFRLSGHCLLLFPFKYFIRYLIQVFTHYFFLSFFFFSVVIGILFLATLPFLIISFLLCLCSIHTISSDFLLSHAPKYDPNLSSSFLFPSVTWLVVFFHPIFIFMHTSMPLGLYHIW